MTEPLGDQLAPRPRNHREDLIIEIDADGNAYVVGSRDRDTGNFFEAVVTKIEGIGGSVLWEKILGGTDDYDTGLGIALDSEGNVLVTGLGGPEPPAFHLIDLNRSRLDVRMGVDDRINQRCFSGA